MDGDPDRKGRPRFRTPTYLPSPGARPDGVQEAGRRLSSCPQKTIPAWVWSAIRDWDRWRTYKELPRGLPLHKQEARVIEAFTILSNEVTLIRLHHQEKASKKKR